MSKYINTALTDLEKNKQSITDNYKKQINDIKINIIKESINKWKYCFCQCNLSQNNNDKSNIAIKIKFYNILTNKQFYIDSKQIIINKIKNLICNIQNNKTYSTTLDDIEFNYLCENTFINIVDKNNCNYKHYICKKNFIEICQSFIDIFIIE